MKIDFPYDHQTVTLEIPDIHSAEVIHPPEIQGVKDPGECMANALDNPVDHLPVSSFSSIRSVAIAINDKTRPVPNSILIPPLLTRLHHLGIPDHQIRFFIASGTHLPMKMEETRLILPPDILSRYPIQVHNCDDPSSLVYLGITSRDTPVWINRAYYEADLKISVGNIEPHHFAGFSGGAKTVAIGLAGRKTISHNHALLIDPLAVTNEYDRNPLRMDIEEIGDMAKVQFCLNAILNSQKEIVYAIAGSPRAVMKQGIELSRKVCSVPIRHPFDVVLVSPGGAPKDINFYQSQKALTHASMVTRDGGTIILLAACPEGPGSDSYFEFMKSVHSPQDALERFKTQEFQIGPHKAYLTARILSRVKVYLASKMPTEMVETLQIQPIDLQKISAIPELKASGIRVGLMPYGVMTIPDLPGSIPLIS